MSPHNVMMVNKLANDTAELKSAYRYTLEKFAYYTECQLATLESLPKMSTHCPHGVDNHIICQECLDTVRRRTIPPEERIYALDIFDLACKRIVSRVKKGLFIESENHHQTLIWEFMVNELDNADKIRLFCNMEDVERVFFEENKAARIIERGQLTHT